ncbi:amino acid ABC transporter permease [Halocynthiibacter namhaensis]|uniref:amino acid ABC transporter permease n=1 Tax=Halocynthiibacter namhaensis TaxID=1290553 RepID=UPI0005795D87|nr:amino acid ABC transporter permease [Halocynthiibacter namhaensis]
MTPRPSEDKPDFPWWLVAIIAFTAFFVFQVVGNPLYEQVAGKLFKGVKITVFVTLIGFLLASIFGLMLAVASLSKYQILRQLSRFYVEVIRGLPILVILLYVSFVVAPGIVQGWNFLAESIGIDPIRTRDFTFLWRAIIALTIGYSAFISEVFRAGILSVEEGQIEAAEALGLNGWQRFRHIIFPQAIRTIMPPLGNDFIAMIKDSSLVSVLGVLDITQLGKVTAAGNFRYFETYNVVAMLYLTLTVTLSLLLRKLEAKMRGKYP